METIAAATMLVGAVSVGAVGVSPASAAPAATTTTTAPGTPPPSKAWLLADLDTGRILASDNEHLRLRPASLTKMLTALVAYDWLYPLGHVRVSARDANVYPDRIGMKAGEVWPIMPTLQSLLADSANDAAYAIAERISGTVEAFAPVLNDAAAQIGMTDHPVFTDPAGLDNGEGVGTGNLVSARDLAIAGRALLAVPQLAQIVSQAHVAFTAPDSVLTTIASKNRVFLNGYAGAIGVKTGFTDAAGFSVVEAARRSGRTFLAVVMAGSSSYQTAEMLLDKGFSTPAAAEPATDVLPPVQLPRPGGPPLTTTTSSTTSTTRVITSLSTPPPTASAAPGAPSAGAGLTGWPGLAGGAAIVVVIVTGVLIRRRRVRPAGAHSRGR